MSRRRDLLFLPLAAAVLAGLLWGFSGLPHFGSRRNTLGERVAAQSLARRHTLNQVTAVMFDYRAMDTVGEELLLLSAVAGTALLLRAMKDEAEEGEAGSSQPGDGAEADSGEKESLPGRETREPSEALQFLGRALAGAAGLVGLYFVAYAHVSPGGGFQGGVLLSGAGLALFLAHDYRALERLTPVGAIEGAESLGAAAMVVLGCGGLIASGSFLFNFLAPGTPGELLSAGVIPLLSFSSGLAVGSGVLLVASDFIRQTLFLREGRSVR